MNGLAFSYVLCVVLFFANAVVWLMQGYVWTGCFWLAAIPALFVVHRWILDA